MGLDSIREVHTARHAHQKENGRILSFTRAAEHTVMKDGWPVIQSVTGMNRSGFFKG